MLVALHVNILKIIIIGCVTVQAMLNCAAVSQNLHTVASVLVAVKLLFDVKPI